METKREAEAKGEAEDENPLHKIKSLGIFDKVPSLTTSETKTASEICTNCAIQKVTKGKSDE